MMPQDNLLCCNINGTQYWKGFTPDENKSLSKKVENSMQHYRTMKLDAILLAEILVYEVELVH